MPPLSSTTVDTRNSWSKVTTNASAGTWTQVISDKDNQGILIQNKSAQSIFILEAAAQPTSGAKDGEIEIAASPATFLLPYRPKLPLWVRSAGSSQDLTVVKW